MKKEGEGKPENPDIALDANVRMRELHFHEVPDPRVDFRGSTGRNSVWGSKRENLPDEIVFIIGHISWNTSFWGHSKADGFIIESDDQIRDATSQEWNEYGGL